MFNNCNHGNVSEEIHPAAIVSITVYTFSNPLHHYQSMPALSMIIVINPNKDLKQNEAGCIIPL